MTQKKYTDGSGVAEIWANTKNYIAVQLLDKSDVGHTHSASDITSGLATVATTGSYDDLTDKPVIPPDVEFASEQEVTDTVLSEINYLL